MNNDARYTSYQNMVTQVNTGLVQMQKAAARMNLEETAKQLQLASDKDSARFALLFDDLQAKATAMVELAEAMRAQGKAEQAEKFMGALKRALEALRESLEGEGE